MYMSHIVQFQLVHLIFTLLLSTLNLTLSKEFIFVCEFVIVGLHPLEMLKSLLRSTKVHMTSQI